MALPGDAIVSAAVVGGEDQRGAASVLGERLQPVPQPGDQAIVLAGRVEVEVVPPVVGEIVGLAQGEVDHARAVGVEMSVQFGTRQRVVPDAVPQAGQGFAQFPTEVVVFVRPLGRGGLPSRVDRDATPLAVDDEGEDIPRGEGHDPLLKRRLGVQPLEDCDVGIVLLVVRVDARVDEPAQ